jgi:hypothetical protein
MEPEGSLPYSQVLPTCLPNLSQLHPVPTTRSNFLKIHLNIILPSTSGSPQWNKQNWKIWTNAFSLEVCKVFWNMHSF